MIVFAFPACRPFLLPAAELMESGSDMLDCLLMMDNNLTIKQAEDRIYTVYAWLTQVSHGHECTIIIHSNISKGMEESRLVHLSRSDSSNCISNWICIIWAHRLVGSPDCASFTMARWF